MTIHGNNKYISDRLSCLCRPLKGLENRKVIQIACGDHHSMALTNGIHSYFICHSASSFDILWLTWIDGDLSVEVQSCCSFRWSGVRVGGELSWSAGFEERSSRLSVCSTCSESEWDPAGSDQRWRRPQLCVVSLWSRVWMGKELCWTAGPRRHYRSDWLCKDLI